MVNLRQQIIFNASFAFLACSSSRAFAAVGVSDAQTKTIVDNKLNSRTVFSQQDKLYSALRAGEISNNDDGISKISLTKKVLVSAALGGLFSQRNILSQLSLNALRAYDSSLVTHPLLTKVATGASLSVIGDYLAQVKDIKSSDDDKEEYDVPRAVSFAVFDACYSLIQHFAIPIIIVLGQGRLFHKILSKIPLVEPTMAFTAAMERTVIYQFALIPFVYYPTFFTFTGMMQGLSVKETIQRAKVSFFTCWKRNLLFWVPIQMVMFGLIVERWQIPFVCVMGIIWSLILSVTAGDAGKQSS